MKKEKGLWKTPINVALFIAILFILFFFLMAERNISITGKPTILVPEVGESLLDPQQCKFFGDINDDGRVSTLDVAFLRRYAKGNDPSKQEEIIASKGPDKTMKRGDLNMDGVVDSSDANLLQQYILGNQPGLPRCADCSHRGNFNGYGDNLISFHDLILLKAYVRGQIASGIAKTYAETYGDLNQDEKIDDADISLLSDYLYGKINHFPVCASPIPTQLECKELLPGQNKEGDHRIDIVFVGWGYNESFMVPFIAKKTLLDDKTGLFVTEPFKSNRNAFNFWYVSLSGGETGDKGAYKLIDVCTKKLGYYKDTLPENGLFSSRLFYIFLTSSKNFAGSDYAPGKKIIPGETRSLTTGITYANVALPVEMGVLEYSPKLGVTFLHEVGHLLTWSYYPILLGSGQSFALYNNPLTEGVVKDYDFRRLSEDYYYPNDPIYIDNDKGFSREHTQCYAPIGSSNALNACRDKIQNQVFGDLIGNGCGKEGVIDCCTNDLSRISRGARSCASCPTCHEDSKYDLEVSCYEGCDRRKGGTYRATFNSIMKDSSEKGSDPNAPNVILPPSYGPSNERILRQRIQALTGKKII